MCVVDRIRLDEVIWVTGVLGLSGGSLDDWDLIRVGGR